MQYFDNLPKLIYTDKNGTQTIRTNLLARASIIPKILSNSMLYYQYDVQDGDTPEIVAHKYYGDSYRYWIVLFANQMLDPQWDWPLSSNQFNDYLNSKYGNDDIYGTIHHYEKVVTTVDEVSLTTTVNVIQISMQDYYLLETGTTIYTLPNGGQSTVTVEGNIVSVYEYEVGINESKRTISVLNSSYVNQLETEIKKIFN